MDRSLNSLWMISIFAVGMQCLNTDVSTTLNCGSYTCKLNTQNFLNTTCAYYNYQQSKYYTRKCSSRVLNYCLTLNQANSTCIGNQPLTTGYAWPGEKCNTTVDCSSHCAHGCNSGVCIGSFQGESCIRTDDCQPGLRCANSICLPQIEIGRGGCVTDSDCVNHAGCNNAQTIQDSVCYPYYTISDHLPVGYCKNNISMLCDSGNCMLNNGVFECMKLVKSSAVPKTCNDNSECASIPDPYFNNGSLQGACACAFSTEPKSYCTLFAGDSYSAEKVKYLKKWIQSDFINKCNGARRFNLQCIQNWWTKSEYNRYFYYFLASFDYPKYLDSEDCVTETFLPDYYQAKKNA